MNYQLIIVHRHGEKNYVDVSNSEEDFRNTTVRELKRKLRFIEGLENYQTFRLLYTDKELRDDDTLGDHGITHRSTLIAVFRLLAGGGAIPEDGGVHRTESMEKLGFNMQTCIIS